MSGRAAPPCMIAYLCKITMPSLTSWWRSTSKVYSLIQPLWPEKCSIWKIPPRKQWSPSLFVLNHTLSKIISDFHIENKTSSGTPPFHFTSNLLNDSSIIRKWPCTSTYKDLLNLLPKNSFTVHDDEKAGSERSLACLRSSESCPTPLDACHWNSQPRRVLQYPPGSQKVLNSLPHFNEFRQLLCCPFREEWKV